MEINKERVIWHYTSIKALYNILESKVLWLGNIKQMNDTREIEYFINKIVREGVKKKLELNNKKEKIGQLDELFDKQIKCNKDKSIYAMCFIEDKDNAAQWERYAQNAEGVSIGVDYKTLEKISQESSYLYLQPVFYEKSVLDHEHIQNIYDYLLTGKIKGFENIDELFSNIYACAGAFKHPSFKIESEIRLISLPYDKYNNIQYKNMENNIKQYYIFELNVKLDELIKSIIIGPKSSQNVYI